ncbi:hypothetical protein V5799_032407, partial [Amblyomma americanum]
PSVGSAEDSCTVGKGQHGASGLVWPATKVTPLLALTPESVQIQDLLDHGAHREISWLQNTSCWLLYREVQAWLHQQ